MLEIVATTGLEAQDKLAQLVSDAKKVDPFKHITLVVESNHQALQMRRQLVRSLARTGSSSSLVSFSAKTKIDLLASCAQIAEIDWDYQAYENARQATLREVLAKQNEAFAKFANHPESFETLNSYTKQFDWFELDSTLIESVKSKASESTTKVSLQLLNIALAVQEELRSSEHLSPAAVAKRIEGLVNAEHRQRISKSLGLVVSLVGDYPHALETLVENLIGQDGQQRILLQTGGQRVEPAQLVSYPDPETEAKAVVREVANRISLGHAVDQFAVLYTDANQYADIIEHEFEQANIAWNGIATDSPVNTRAGLATKGYFAVAKNVLASGTFSRSDLLLLLRVSSINVNGEELQSTAIQKFIRKNSLFNEVQNWIPLLKATHEGLGDLNSELNDLISWKVDQEEIDEKLYEIRQAKIAGSLVDLIDALTVSAESLGSLDSNHALATNTWKEINTFFPQISDTKLPIERLAFEKLAETFGSAHAGSLSGRDSARKALNVLSQTVFLKLAQLKMQHGELSRGVYVGPISQNGALFFENLWVLGAGEGMLPQLISEDPIFPDELKAIVARESPIVLKSISDRVLEIEANFSAVTAGAKNLSISYPRGATLVKGEGKPSAWIEKLNTLPKVSVPAASEFRLEATGAISESDLHSKKSASLIVSTSSRSKQLEAALWFTEPAGSVFVGNLEEHVPEPIIDFDQKSLSASSVEKFLKCAHNFFTTKLLGISDTEDVDSIDEIRAIDFGKAVHKSFERLLKEFPNLSPHFGEAYSSEAKAKFSELFDEECELLVARGQAGWAPLFESRKRLFLDNLNEYFSLEASARNQVVLVGQGPYRTDIFLSMRDEDFLRPQLAEFEFDKSGDGLLHIPVAVEGYPNTRLKFTGSIDRVDVSANREHVGLVDFKTGSRRYMDRSAAVQDLLYEYAIRHNTQFLGVKKVSSRYLFLSKKIEDSGLVDIRLDRDKRVFLSEADQGIVGTEYSEALTGNQRKAEEELLDKLKLLVSAAIGGRFLTHNVDAANSSFANCVTCKKLGKRQISRLSQVLYSAIAENPESEDEDQI